MNNAEKWICDRLTEDADFGKKKIIFSDEARFDLGWYVNKQNCRIWGTENPHAYIEKSMHTAEATLDVLRSVFEDRIISRRADVVWPPRCCDLATLDYYLWGVVKDECYANKPETIDALKDNIREAIGEIQLLIHTKLAITTLQSGLRPSFSHHSCCVR